MLDTPKNQNAEEVQVAEECYLPCPIMDSFVDDREGKWLSKSEREDPNPDGRRVPSKEMGRATFLSDKKTALATWDILEEIAYRFTVEPAFRIKVGRDIKYIQDVAPFLLMKLMRDVSAVDLRASLAANNPILRVVEALGIAESAGDDGKLDEVEHDQDLWALPILTNKLNSHGSYAKNQNEGSARVIRQIDTWLGQLEPAFKLTGEGKKHFGSTFGELLENAEHHLKDPETGEKGKWSLAGFMGQRMNEETNVKDQFHCFFTLVTEGGSIADTILKTPQKHVQKNINEYVGICREQGCNLSDDSLGTLLAIQDGMTSRPTHDSGNGGFGLMNLLYALKSLAAKPVDGEEGPRLTILSGGTCMQFKSKEIQLARKLNRDKDLNHDSLRHIWFNDSNTSNVAPDQDRVFELNRKLSGTVFTFCLRLSGKDLVERVGA